MDYLLDTSALLSHCRDERGAARVQAIFDDEEAEVHISAVSIAEFARSMAGLGADISEARSAVLEYAGIVTRVIPIDSAVSIRAFEIGSSCTTRLPLIDALIAACAGTIGAVLVHRDAHFETIQKSLLLHEML